MHNLGVIESAAGEEPLKSSDGKSSACLQYWSICLQQKANAEIGKTSHWIPAVAYISVIVCSACEYIDFGQAFCR